ncbi:semaphorin-7A-like isoform X2 [Mustelus asterias]
MPLPASLVFLQLLGCISAFTSPRLNLNLSAEIEEGIKFNLTENYSTTLREGSIVYVGGKEVLYQIDFGSSPSQVHEIPVPVNNDSKTKCQKHGLGHCENFIMVVQKFNATHFLLCGSNAQEPRCWLLFNDNLNLIINGRGRPLGTGVCPYTPKNDFASLVVDERFYAAAPVFQNGAGNVLRGFKKNSVEPWLLSVDEWLEDPHFVGMSPMDEHIFIFFREKNLPGNLDIDPWMSRIGRVCKDDTGGSRQRLRTKWATFLKARLLCNIPANHVHFNRIQDVFVVRSNNSEDRVYGIFKSNWNGAAICSYSVKEINHVFHNSDFKGFSEAIPEPRPGTCVPNTQSLPDKVLNVVENYPEMNRDVNPIGNSPLVVKKEDVFQKIAVDSVVGVDGTEYWVLFLAMDNGRILKGLEFSQSVFTISELTIFQEPKQILSMSLDSETKFLYVTTASEVVRVPLAQCEKYTNSCTTCVMARDPYCAWDAKERTCVPSTSHSKYLIQDIEHGNTRKCPQEKSYRQRGPGEEKNPALPLEGTGPVYLSCPKQSYHADYSWRVEGQVMDCSLNEDDCLLFISDLSQVKANAYTCSSNERGHEQLHISYLIQGNGSPMHLPRYSVAVYSVLMTVAALFLH